MYYTVLETWLNAVIISAQAALIMVSTVISRHSYVLYCSGYLAECCDNTVDPAQAAVIMVSIVTNRHSYVLYLFWLLG